MNSTRLRVLTQADLPFADSLRRLEGWNQTPADWERFIALEPAGCFLAEWNGRPAATATTLVYGTELAWIGMILVHPEYRRRGIGRALLKHCLEHLQRRGVRCIKLDATPLGRKVYDQLAFQAEYTLTRWQREPGPTRRIPDGPPTRAWSEPDAGALDGLDIAAFGVSRRALVGSLAQTSLCALVVEAAPGRLGGYGLLRKGAQALYLGPLIAQSSPLGRRLIDTLLERGQGETIFWDIPDQNDAAVAQARHHGFIEQRQLTRMALGPNLAPDHPQMQFAIAGPEIG